MLTSNLGENRLYLNEGGFRFTDVTGRAGVAGEGSWATGVTFVDIDGDGWLDIHVAYAGDVEAERRANELYIHQGLNAKGVPVFAESAAAYGIADQGYTTHAAFFDYDRDGDLDLYLVNNSFRPANSFGVQNTRAVRDSLGGDKLYRNDRGRFVDVSEAAGIFGSEIGFGLGVAISDLEPRRLAGHLRLERLLRAGLPLHQRRRRHVYRVGRAADAVREPIPRWASTSPTSTTTGGRTYTWLGHAAGGRIPVQDDRGVRELGPLPGPAEERLPPPVHTQHAAPEPADGSRSARSASWPAWREPIGAGAP